MDKQQYNEGFAVSERDLIARPEQSPPANSSDRHVTAHGTRIRSRTSGNTALGPPYFLRGR